MPTQSEHEELLAAHAESLDLLARVKDYLWRLPPVPVTRDLCREIEQHIESPAAAAQASAARRHLRASEARHGGCYSPLGVPLLLIDMEGQSVQISTQISHDRARQVAELKGLLKLLRGTIKVDMKKGRRKPDRYSIEPDDARP